MALFLIQKSAWEMPQWATTTSAASRFLVPLYYMDFVYFSVKQSPFQCKHGKLPKVGLIPAGFLGCL